jgi:transcriptional regulator
MNGPRHATGLVKGTLDLLVLKGLSGGKKHGYGIAVWLDQVSGGSLAVEDSAVYQALHRLQGRRLVEAEWGTSENNRRARYYRLTRRGVAELKAEASTWHDYATSVTAVLAIDEGR